MSKYKHQLSLEEITTEKKGAVIWPSQITICHVKIQTPTITGKNYYRENRVQSSGHLRYPSVMSKYKHQLSLEKITTGKKGTVI